MLPNSMEDAALNAHLAAQDRAEAAEGMTYRELLDALDEGIDDGAWIEVSGLRREIEERKSDARTALRRRFIEYTLIPQVIGGEVKFTEKADWIRECADTKQYSEMMLDMIIGTRTRDSIIAAMADEYVELVCEDLLMAGFQPE